MRFWPGPCDKLESWKGGRRIQRNTGCTKGPLCVKKPSEEALKGSQHDPLNLSRHDPVHTLAWRRVLAFPLGLQKLLLVRSCTHISHSLVHRPGGYGCCHFISSRSTSAVAAVATASWRGHPAGMRLCVEAATAERL